MSAHSAAWGRIWGAIILDAAASCLKSPEVKQALFGTAAGGLSLAFPLAAPVVLSSATVIAGFLGGSLTSKARDSLRKEREVDRWLQDEPLVRLAAEAFYGVLKVHAPSVWVDQKSFVRSWALALDEGWSAPVNGADPGVAPVSLEDWKDAVREAAGWHLSAPTPAELDLCAQALAREFLARFRKLLSKPGEDGAFKDFVVGTLRMKFAQTNEKLDRLLAQAGPSLEKCTPRAAAPGQKLLRYDEERIAFRGREKELEELGRFLDGPEARFRFCRIAGGPGAGKSRLAWQAMKIASLLGWAAARAARPRALAPDRWPQWRPEASTLIVIDYALDRRDLTAGCLAAMQAASGFYEHPVRVILISREAGGLRWEGFFDEAPQLERDLWDPEDPAGVKTEYTSLGRNRKRDRPSTTIRLGSMSGHWMEMAEDFHQTVTEPARTWEESKAILERVLPKLSNRAPETMPLLVQIAADNAAHGSREEGVDPDQVVNAFLRREVNAWKDARATVQHRNIAIAATMLGGVRHDEVFVSQTGGAPCPHMPDLSGDASPLDQVFSCSAGWVEGRYPKIEPDLIGELLVLRSLAANGGLAMGSANGAEQALATAQWCLNLDQNRVDPFLLNAANSWPDEFRSSPLHGRLNADSRLLILARQVEELRKTGSFGRGALDLLDMADRLVKPAGQASRDVYAFVLASIARGPDPLVQDAVLDRLRSLDDLSASGDAGARSSDGFDGLFERAEGHFTESSCLMRRQTPHD